jgi:putative ABC transport system ATP-binding protein
LRVPTPALRCRRFPASGLIHGAGKAPARPVGVSPWPDVIRIRTTCPILRWMTRNSRISPDGVLVEARRLRRVFKEGDRSRTVLDGLDLQIQPGECVALLGRSGSGKSTLLNLVSGIDRPSSGELIVGGQNLAALSERDRTLFRRRHIGFVFQFFNLIPTLSVAENLRLPLELNGCAGEVDQRVNDWLAAVGLADRADSYPDRLSGGEQQRVALARALVHDPALVLADEPTGNLDAATGRQVLDLLNRLVRDSGKTLLVVTHARAVAALADRVLTLADGRLSEDRDEAIW